MQAWDYLTIETMWEDGALSIESVNGKSMGIEQPGIFKKIVHPRLHEYLNVIGKQGWEVVALNYHQTLGGVISVSTLIAKRPGGLVNTDPT